MLLIRNRSSSSASRGVHIFMSQSSTDRKGLALVLLAAAQFVVVLDASIVNVALPSIGRDLHFARENLSWVVNAYTLVFGGFLLLGGRMADLLGRRRVFTVGLVLFALASLLGGLSSNDGQLIAARALQGLGAAILSPAALSILTTTFAEGAERNRALGLGAIALALISGFVAIELRTSHPLIPFGIFRKRTLTGANVVAVLVAM